MALQEIAIRTMQPADLAFAAACTAGEGWSSETPPVFAMFRAHDAEGCFIAWSGDRRVGICVATSYGAAGFIGELIVIREMRRRGIGRQVMEHAIAYLQRRGAQRIYLDGVVAAVPLYERLGFRKVCRSLRFSGTLPGQAYPDVRPMRQDDLEAVGHLDRAAFGADRRFFLAWRLRQHPALCQVLELDGEIRGFLIGRDGEGVISAGPWVVQAGVPHPERLLESLAVQAGGRTIGLGVLEANEVATATLRALGFGERANPPWRMVLGSDRGLGTGPMCYAIGSPAKG